MCLHCTRVLGRRDYECSQCQQTFAKKSDRDRHLRAVHQGEITVAAMNYLYYIFSYLVSRCMFDYILSGIFQTGAVGKDSNIHSQKELAWASFNSFELFA